MILYAAFMYEELSEEGRWDEGFIFICQLFGCCSVFKQDPFHMYENACFLTLLHASIHHIMEKKHSLWADLVPPFAFLRGGGIHAGIFSFTLNHCHQRIPYAGKSKCQTDGFMSGYTLPRCKSSFFRKCEIKWSYYIKSYNTLHISSWWLETPEQQTKTAVSLQSARVIL